MLLTAAVTLAILLAGGESYTINARFYNAGQLVTGGLVEVAGRPVGTVAGLTVTKDGLANVRLSITDSQIVPLHVGTRAQIRAVGQAGVANQFIDLTPGPPAAPALRDGAVLPTSQTTGMVDLDAILDTLNRPTRQDLQSLIARSDQVFAGSGSSYFNGVLAKLDPALRAVDGVAGELSYDHYALRRLIDESAVAASAISSRSGALSAAVANTARVMEALASERAVLADALTRAPGVLVQARGTLARLSATVVALRPTLRAVPSAAGPLATLVRRLGPTLQASEPVVSRLRALLPGVRRSLAGLASLAGPAVDALGSLTPALKGLMPILTGIRIYGVDFTLGLTNGLAGILASNYNADGHYGRLTFVQNLQTLLAGLPAAVLSKFPLVPGVLSTRKSSAACPGGAEPPAPDGSNPWIPDRSLCDPSNDLPASVNQP
ncbi:MlaD family protein [Conexibacter sp. DBS9H8]|uniref:MlaD family protein n=1 Tax=Conexibacter sp. DBS9H8 TaxID=2937801 RepID=UPI00200E4E32|nr:MlaD family protein [Conexibacter sp. DBS9H8]